MIESLAKDRPRLRRSNRFGFPRIERFVVFVVSIGEEKTKNDLRHFLLDQSKMFRLAHELLDQLSVFIELFPISGLTGIQWEKTSLNLSEILDQG